MSLLLTVLLIELAALTSAAVFFLARSRRSGLETEWDDPVPEQYHQAWSDRHWAGQRQPG